jgi:hypothetical protein
LFQTWLNRGGNAIARDRRSEADLIGECRLVIELWRERLGK